MIGVGFFGCVAKGEPDGRERQHDRHRIDRQIVVEFIEAIPRLIRESWPFDDIDRAGLISHHGWTKCHCEF